MFGVINVFFIKGLELHANLSVRTLSLKHDYDIQQCQENLW